MREPAAADRRHTRNRSTGRGNPDQFATVHRPFLEAWLLRTAIRDNTLAVRRVVRVGVERGLSRQLLRGGCSRHRDSIDVATAIRPGDVCQYAVMRGRDVHVFAYLVWRSRQA